MSFHYFCVHHLVSCHFIILCTEDAGNTSPESTRLNRFTTRVPSCSRSDLFQFFFISSDSFNHLCAPQFILIPFCVHALFIICAHNFFPMSFHYFCVHHLLSSISLVQCKTFIVILFLCAPFIFVHFIGSAHIYYCVIISVHIFFSRVV